MSIEPGMANTWKELWRMALKELWPALVMLALGVVSFLAGYPDAGIVCVIYAGLCLAWINGDLAHKRLQNAWKVIEAQQNQIAVALRAIQQLQKIVSDAQGKAIVDAIARKAQRDRFAS